MRLTALLLLVATGFAPADDRPVPKYEGKSLDYWVSKLELPAEDKERDLAAKALEAFGKDAAPAIPKLLVMLEDKSSDYRVRVWRVFMAMKEAAKPAVPTLVKRLDEGTSADPQGAVEIIANIGPDAKDAVPVLVKLTRKEKLAAPAIRALCAIGADATKDGVPAILAAIRAEPKYTLNWVQNELPMLGSAVVPALVELLDDPPYGLDVREVIRVLGKIGPDAKKAIPALKKLLPTAEELKVVEQECVENEKVAADHNVLAETISFPLTAEEKKRLVETAQRRSVAFAAAEAVARIEPNKEVAEALVLWVRRMPAAHVDHLAELLGRMGEVSALPILRRKVDDWRSRLNREEEQAYDNAIESLARIEKKEKK